MAEMNGGELLMECLANQGVKKIFGIPDGTFNVMFKWELDHGDERDLHFVTMRHEAAGAHMADAMARVTGQPGVVIAGAGPGVANVLAGVATAYAECLPMIVITTTRRSDVINPPRGAMQVFDQLATFKPLVKMGAHIECWERIPEMVGMAWRTALTGIPGPVQLDIPENIMNMKKPVGTVEPTPPIGPTLARSGAPADKIAEAAEMLIAAKEPMIHAGAAAQRTGASPELIELAEYLSMPVTTSPAGRGAIPEDHPNSVPPTSMLARAALSQSDVVLGVGCSFGELDFFGKAPLWGPPDKQKLIQIHIAPEKLGANRKVDVPLLGHAKVVLGQLLAEVKKRTEKREDTPKLKQYRDLNKMTETGNDAKFCKDVAPILTGKLVKEARAFFPRNAITVMDGGNTSLWNVHFNKIFEPCTMLWTSEFGHLGTGLPFAIGAKLAAPDRPVYLISGDSAFGFNMQELETARRNGLNIICMVAVDDAWGMEKTSQGRIFGSHEKYLNCDHAPVCYDKVAEAMGCFGAFVEKPEEIRPALEAATASNLPAVLHVAIDKQANVTPPGAELWVATHSAK